MSNELNKCQISVKVPFIINQYSTYNNYPINAEWNAYWVCLACTVSGWSDQEYVIISWQTYFLNKITLKGKLYFIKGYYREDNFKKKQKYGVLNSLTVSEFNKYKMHQQTPASS